MATSRGSLRHGIAPHARFNNGDGHFRLPLELPYLVEGALTARRILLQPPPGNPQHTEPVQKVAALQIGWLTHIEIISTGVLFQRQSETPGPCQQVALEWDHGRSLRDGAHHFAHDELTMD